MNHIPTSFLTTALALVMTVSVHAQEKIGPDRYQVVLHANPHPATPKAARQMLSRIEDAADVVCGAQSSDLREVMFAIRRSACWRESVSAAVTRTGDPLLAEAYRQAAKARESA
jgi:UrcA family protein